MRRCPECEDAEELLGEEMPVEDSLMLHEALHKLTGASAIFQIKRGFHFDCECGERVILEQVEIFGKVLVVGKCKCGKVYFRT